MKKQIYFLHILIISALLTGCRSYVEVDQPGNRILSLTSDYDALLNNSYTMTTSYTLPWAYCDDFELTDEVLEQQLSSTYRQTYTWAADLYNDQNDGDWDRLYNQIYVANLVIDNVMDSDGGTETEKKQVLAKAKVFRANAYLDLVSIYAKQYDALTAESDLGVPLVAHPNFTQALTRASVQQSYDFIMNDLNEALPDLQSVPMQVVEPSQAAVHGLLARIYLLMGNYAGALEQANTTLGLMHTLLDLNDYANGEAYPDKYKHPEIILYRQMGGTALTNYSLSTDLQALFEPTDLRWQLYTIDGHDDRIYLKFNGRAFWRHRLFATGGNFIGLDVPEIMLIKAECLARNGQSDEAMGVLNTLREKRFLPENYQALTAATTDEALRLVIDERRREMMGRGTRLFDQKRLNKEAAFAKTMERTYLGEKYTLEPNADRYVFPIASKYIALNPEIIQNPR